MKLRYVQCLKQYIMALPVNDKGNLKFGNQPKKGATNGSKFLAKPTGKAVSGGKKPVKTGGMRGS